MGISIIDILFEDEDLVAVNKPPFLPSHVTLDPSRPHLQGILENQLKQKLTLFHRLDVDTTGIVLLGKSERIKKPMSELFLGRALEKKYWAVVEGRWLPMWTEVRTYIKKIGGKYYNTPKGSASERAVTKFKILHQSPDKSLIEATLETGKTHQIRLHCLEMRHPVCGDRNYGTPDRAGVPLALHSRRLQFVHPITSKPLDITAPLPDYWNDKWLRADWKLT